MRYFENRRQRERIKRARKMAKEGSVSHPIVAPWFRHRWVMIVGAATGILLVGFATILFLHANSAKRLAERTDAAQARIIDRARAFQNDYTASTDEERQQQLRSIVVDGDLPDCQATTVGKNVDETRERCQAFVAMAKQLQTHAQNVAAMMEYDTALRRALNEAHDSAEVVDIAAQHNKWQAQTDAVGNAPMHSSVGEVHQQIATAFAAISQQWKQLSEANTAEDAEAFTRYEDEISSKYMQLRETAAGLRHIYDNARATLQQTLDAIRAI